jgi:beta-lactamase regulating signal transducer with metallopeptidase domain
VNALDSIAAWLVTYAMHSTLLLGAAWLGGWMAGWLGGKSLPPAATNLAWKVALVGGIVTASVQTALDLRPAGSIAIGPAVPAVPAAANTKGDPVDRVVADLTSREASVEEQSAPGGSSTAGPRTLPSATTILTAAWAALAFLFMTWYAGRRLILVGRLGDRRAVSDGELPRLLDELRRGAGLRLPVRLTASSTISSPVALGAREICLPSAALIELEPEQQRAMLAHELAHLVRRDPQWLGLACLVERAFFFQPLNRLARARIQQSAEYLADEWAAGHSGRVPLARCLVKVAEWIQASPLGVPVAGMAEERSQLSTRVTRLLESAGTGRGIPRWAAGTLVVGALAAIVVFAPGASGSALPDLLAGSAMPTEEPTLGSDAQEAESPEPHPTPEVGQEKSPVGEATPPKVQQDTTVVKALIARLRDEDAGVRQAAANALGRIGDPLAIPDLVRTLDDPDREVRSAAINALSNYERGVPAAPIRRLLEADDPEVRSQAASILGELRDRESIPALSKLVRDPDANVRQQAIDALTEVEDPAAGPAILAALTDANADVRHSAFHAMEHLKVPVTGAQLTRGLRDENADVRVAAIELASERRMTDVVPDLVRLLEDNNADVRVSSAEALSEMASESARTALRTAMTHRDPKVRRVAVEYFGEENEQ